MFNPRSQRKERERDTREIEIVIVAANQFNIPK